MGSINANMPMLNKQAIRAEARVVRFNRIGTFSASGAQQKLLGEWMEREAVVEVPY